jgi:hypothetical protein
MDDKKPSLFEQFAAFLEGLQALIIVFVVVGVLLFAVAAVVVVLWVIVAGLAVGLYKLFIAFWKWAKSDRPKDIFTKATVTASKIVSDEFHVSNSFVKALSVWTCRIIGLLGCFAGITGAIDAINGEAKPDEPGLGGIIMVFLICGAMTAYGFWPRRKNKLIQSK